MVTGKKIRLSRLFNEVSQKSVLVPLDHGATLGPIKGISNISKVLNAIGDEASAVDGLILHRGTAVHSLMPNCSLPVPLILHLSASTALGCDPTHKVLVAQVEEALRLGADAVSVHVNLGVASEKDMLRDLGLVASKCQLWGMPLLTMMYSKSGNASAPLVPQVKLAARVAAELGADVVKVSYPGTIEAMEEVVEGCFVPVVVAGGERSSSDTDVLDMVKEAISGGAMGVCIGRNVFQHGQPGQFVRQLSAIVHGTALEARARSFEVSSTSSLN